MGVRDRAFGPVIAERRLHPRDAPRRTVVVSLGKPRKTKGHDDWECPFRIAGAGIRRLEHGYGIDAFQALMNALEGIRHYLDTSGMRLAWTGFFDDQTGFQRFIPMLPDVRVTRRMERLVEREGVRWGKAMKQRYEARARRKK